MLIPDGDREIKTLPQGMVAFRTDIEGRDGRVKRDVVAMPYRHNHTLRDGVGVMKNW